MGDSLIVDLSSIFIAAFLSGALASSLTLSHYVIQIYVSQGYVPKWAFLVTRITTKKIDGKKHRRSSNYLVFSIVWMVLAIGVVEWRTVIQPIGAQDTITWLTATLFPVIAVLVWVIPSFALIRSSRRASRV